MDLRHAEVNLCPQASFLCVNTEKCTCKVLPEKSRLLLALYVYVDFDNYQWIFWCDFALPGWQSEKEEEREGVRERKYKWKQECTRKKLVLTCCVYYFHVTYSTDTDNKTSKMLVWCEHNCLQVIFRSIFFWKPHTCRGRNRWDSESLDHAMQHPRMTGAWEVCLMHPVWTV